MIGFLIYLILILCLIYTNGFFNLFKDDVLTKKQLSFLFFLKTLAIPVFYYIYQYKYGGIEKFDSGKFYNDAKVINEIAGKDFPTYLKLLAGLQNDKPGSYDYLLVQNTWNWDNGEVKDFLYNDNRVIIRLHSIFHFISFHSIFVHALFSCFLSFIGIFYLYKSFKSFFKDKELPMIIILCLFPALWFYTGALLKEGLCLCVLGLSIYHVKQLIEKGMHLKTLIIVLLLLWVSLLLKPYLLFLALLCFGLFFLIKNSKKIKRPILIYTVCMVCFVIVLNGLSIIFKQRSLPEAALVHQRIFAGVAKGGIFVFDETKFIRLPFDSTLIQKVPKTDNIFTIRKGASYMYWEKSVSPDTMYCKDNLDTLHRYQLAYKIPVNHSNLKPLLYSNGIMEMILNCYYYSLFYPLFFNAGNFMQYLASLENLLILLSFLFIIKGFVQQKKELFLPFCFIFFALSICLLIGIATPNSGAIFRYRAPAMLFILLAALYFIKEDKLKFFKRIA